MIKSGMDTIVFSSGMLIDGAGEQPIADACVVVEKSLIRFAGSSRNAPIPEGACVVDISGKTIMPGLIDAHVHVGNIAWQMEQTALLSPAVYVHQATRNLEDSIALGFTALRDAAGLDWSFIDAIDHELINGPRLFLSVSPLTPSGGHFDMRGPFRDEIVPRNRLQIYPEICDGPDAVRKAAREALRRGANQIKVAADGGVDSPSDQPGHWQFSVPELQAAVEVAEAAGTYVMAHAYTPRAIGNCLEAGVRSIEHGNLLDEATANRMAEAGAFLVPTLSVYDILAKEGREELAIYTRNKLDLVARAGREAVKIARDAGVEIASGSDIIGPFQDLKGREITIKSELLTPLEAIVSATRTNARLLQVEDRIGTLGAGKEADLIVVDGNPLEDPTLFERGRETVRFVMKAGRIVKDTLILPERDG